MSKFEDMVKGVLLHFLLLVSGVGISQNYFEQGYKEFYQTNDYTKAIELFTKAIENKQNLADSYLLRGAAKIQNGQHSSGATTDLESSIAIDSNNYKAYFYYGKFYLSQGFFNSSIKYYDKAILKNPKSANCYDQRAIAKGQNENYESALQDENIAINLDPKKSIYWVNRGVIKTKLKLFNEAISDFNQAIKIDNDPQGYSNRGVAFAELNRHSEAINDFTIGIKKLPYAKDLPYLRGLSYIAIGKINLACDDFNKSKEMGYSLSEEILKKYCSKK